MATGAGEQFWEQQRLPSVLKHDLLRRYLPVFAGKTGSRAVGVVYLATQDVAVTRTEAPPHPSSSFRSHWIGALPESTTACSSTSGTWSPSLS